MTQLARNWCQDALSDPSVAGPSCSLRAVLRIDLAADLDDDDYEVLTGLADNLAEKAAFYAYGQGDARFRRPDDERALRLAVKSYTMASAAIGADKMM